MALGQNQFTICWPNRVNEADWTTSGPSFTAARPFSNALDSVFSRRARTADDNSTLTLTADLTPYSPRPIGCVAIAAHNFSMSAKWRIRLYRNIDDVGVTDGDYDSGLIPVWPSSFTIDTVEWEENNFWSFSVPPETIGILTTLAYHFATDNVICEAVVIDIEDSTSDDYLEFGRVFIARAMQPAIGQAYGSATGVDVTTDVDTALDGTEYFYVRKGKRTMTAQLETLTRDEAYSDISLMQLTVGRHGEVLVAYEIEDSPASFMRTFIGNLVEFNPLTQPYFENHETTLQVREKL